MILCLLRFCRYTSFWAQAFLYGQPWFGILNYRASSSGDFHTQKKQKKEGKASSSSICVVYFYITFRNTQHIHSTYTHVAIALHLQYKRSQQKMVPYQHEKGVIINYIATFLHKIHTISQMRVKSICLAVFSYLSSVSPLILLAGFKTQFIASSTVLDLPWTNQAEICCNQ